MYISQKNHKVFSPRGGWVGGWAGGAPGGWWGCANEYCFECLQRFFFILLFFLLICSVSGGGSVGGGGDAIPVGQI